MKLQWLIPFLLAAAIVLAGCDSPSTTEPPSTAGRAPASAAELLNAFETAVTAKDREALVSLVNWDGVSADTRAFLNEIFDEMLAHEVKSVSLAPLPDDLGEAMELDGVRYTHNVTLVGMLDVQFAQEGNSTQLPYGMNDDGWHIAGTIEERATGAETGG